MALALTRITLYFILLCPVQVGFGEASAPSPHTPSPEYFKPLVLLSSIEKGDGSNFSFQTRRVGFVVGDGTLIVTAEHCIDEFRAPPAPSSSRRLFAISPYYGDIFPVEILAYDDIADVAILKAVWPTHPAFALAEPNSLQPGDTSLVPSIPPLRNAQRQINTHFLFEQLTVDHVDRQKADRAILFTEDGLIERGWSGSPILLQESHKVTGVICQLRWHKVTRALFFKRTILQAAGCHIESILKLMQANHLDGSALADPSATFPDIADSETVFGHIQDTFSALVAQDTSTALTHIQQAADERPESAYLHLWLAHIASAQDHKTEDEGKAHLQLVQSSLDTALALAPEDPHILAVCASHLNKGNTKDLAIEYSHAALRHDPDNPLALYTQLVLGYSKYPNLAVMYGQRLTAIEPNNTMAWFYTSMALLNDHQPEEALLAAQQAVVTDPNGLIRAPLARALTALDRTEEARVELEFMTRKCGCANCWFRYASFLLNHQSDQTREAQQALDTARTTKKQNGMTARKLDQLQIQLYKQTDPNQAQSEQHLTP